MERDESADTKKKQKKGTRNGLQETPVGCEKRSQAILRWCVPDVDAADQALCLQLDQGTLSGSLSVRLCR